MNVLLTGAFAYREDELQRLKESTDASFFYHKNEFESVDETVASKIEIVVCNALFQYNRPDIFVNLKFVILTSVGLDRIPIAYFEKHKIKVINAAGLFDNEIAEYVIAELLSVLKKHRFFIENQKKSIWNKERNIKLVKDQKIGILGCGRIGSRIACLLKPFGPYVIGFDIKRIDDLAFSRYAQIDEFDNFINDLDVLIISCPLNSSTFHFINKDRLSRLKNGAILCNCSRGAIIDTTELINYLKSNSCSVAVLDVFEKEPLESTSPLWKMGNVVITPHNSFCSVNNHNNLFKYIRNSIIECATLISGSVGGKNGQ